MADLSKINVNNTEYDLKDSTARSGLSTKYDSSDTAETTLADDDKMPFYDTSASGKRNSTWANIKAKLKTYFDTIYSTFSGAYADLTGKPDLTVYMQKGVDYVTAGQRSGTTLGTKATAEGYNTTASGDYAHAEGYVTLASGQNAHTEGTGTQATYVNTHAEGRETVAEGANSHAEGRGTRASATNQHVEGMFNVGRNDTLHEIGKGWDDVERMNAFAVKADGMVFASDGADDISDYTADSDNRVLTYGNTYGDSTDMDGKIRVDLTLAQFNQLTQAQKDDPRVTYYITDMENLNYPVQDNGSATDLTDGALATGRTIENWGDSKYIPAPVASTLVASKTDTSELTGTYTPTRNGRIVLYCGAGSANRTIKARMLSLEANVKYGNYIYTTLPAYNSESLMYLDVYKGVNYYYQCNGHGSAYIYMT